MDCKINEVDEMLLEAMCDMRISGCDSEGNRAMDVFLTYYRQNWDEEVRKQDNRDMVFWKVCDWWMENGYKYR